MTRDAALARYARDHHGLFRTADAVALGVTPTMLTTRRQRGAIELLEPRVWIVAGTPRTWQQRLLAGAWAERGLGSHRAAGALWELGGCRPGIVEVLTLRWRRRPNSSVRVHETTSLHADDHAELDGIPVTSVARTIVDLAAVVPRSRVETALDSVWQRGLATPEELWACIERLDTRGRPWVHTPKLLVARRVGADLGPNRFEQRLYDLIGRAGLSLPEAQVDVLDSDGTFLGRVDWLYREARLVLECDSFEWHGAWFRRKRDIRRDRRLVAAGYTVLRFSWEDLVEFEAQVIADLSAALGRLAA